jgi:hypothetical protein
LDNNSSPLLMVKVSYYKPVFTAWVLTIENLSNSRRDIS